MKQYIAYIFICLGFMLWNKDALAQQNLSGIHGTIQTETGDAQSGVTVIVAEHPAFKAVSGANGTFVIPGSIGQHLLIKQANRLLKRVAIDQDTMTIIIKDEGIPIGYGRSRSLDELTGAVGFVSADQLPVRSSIENPRSLLFGKIPGLIVLSNPNSGLAPNPSFLVRGPGTFGNTNPLILVDGFRWEFLRSLTPEAIKSVSVLKDASALALYGERGANGVILITTKHGGVHPLRVNASVTEAVAQPLGLPHMLGSADYANALNEALVNDGLQPRYSPKEVDAYKSGEYPYLYPNVNWFDQALRNYGLQTNANATFDGGNDIARYFVLLNYSHISGILRPASKNQGYNTQKNLGQFNFRGNLNVNLTKSLLLKFEASYYTYEQRYPDAGVNEIMSSLYRIPSGAFPVKLPDGTWGGTQIYNENPRGMIESTGTSNPTARQAVVNAVVRQNLDSWVKGLNLEIGFHYFDYGSFYQSHHKKYQYGSITPILGPEGNVLDTMVNKYSSNTDLDYSHSFGYQLQLNNIYGKLGYSTFFGNNKLDAMLLVQQNKYDPIGLNEVIHYRKAAANVHYGINGTYFFDVAASYAGRNLLPPGHQYSFFPAVSAGWLLSNENFLRNVSFINRLKLRASWGIIGMDNIPTDEPYEYGYDYGVDYHAAFFTDGYTHYASFGLPTLPTPADKFTVERSHKTNVGVDATLFHHLDFMTNLFYDRRTDIIIGTGGTISDVIGIPTPVESAGIIELKGLEAELKWQDTTGSVIWNIGGQFSYAHNEIVNENEAYRPYDYLKRTGKPVGQYFGLQAVGFFKDAQDIKSSPKQEFGPVQPGDIKYKDQNKDGVINENDEGPIGYAGSYPQIYYSATLGLQYKGFGFSVLFQGTGRQTAYLTTSSVYWPLQNNNNISEYYYKHRWTPQTAATATLPRLTTQSNPNNFRGNSIWLTNESYLELRYVELSYTLPASLVKPLHINNVKIMAQGRNLYSWDHIPVGLPGSFSNAYPMLRYYSLGLDVVF